MKNLLSMYARECRHPLELKSYMFVSVCVRVHMCVCMWGGGRRTTWLDLWLRTIALRSHGEGLGETREALDNG